jgi:hypothetical protein
MSTTTRRPMSKSPTRSMAGTMHGRGDVVEQPRRCAGRAAPASHMHRPKVLCAGHGRPGATSHQFNTCRPRRNGGVRICPSRACRGTMDTHRPKLGRYIIYPPSTKPLPGGGQALHLLETDGVWIREPWPMPDEATAATGAIQIEFTRWRWQQEDAVL